MSVNHKILKSNYPSLKERPMKYLRSWSHWFGGLSLAVKIKYEMFQPMNVSFDMNEAERGRCYFRKWGVLWGARGKFLRNLFDIGKHYQFLTEFLYFIFFINEKSQLSGELHHRDNVKLSSSFYQGSLYSVHWPTRPGKTSR